MAARVAVFVAAAGGVSCAVLFLWRPVEDLLSIHRTGWFDGVAEMLLSAVVSGVVFGIVAASQVGRGRQDAATRWGLGIGAGVGTLVVCAFFLTAVLPLLQMAAALVW